jgi:hypothetical protein
MKQPSVTASTVNAVGAAKTTSDGMSWTAQKEDMTVAESASKKKTVRNSWLPSTRGMKDPDKSDSTPSIPAKDTVASVKTPSVNNDSKQTKETDEACARVPVSPDTSDGPAPKPKIRLNIKETPKENDTSPPTKDAVNSVSKPAGVHNGSKSPVTANKTPKKQASEPTATIDTADEADISLKSILAPEKKGFDENTAFDSLQQYIQNKARDMTLKRMGEKPGFDAFQPTVKKESIAVKPKKVKRETLDDKLPIFMAPKVDDPYAETKVSVQGDEEEEATEISNQPASDEQVAKSLKKSRRSRSITNKAQKSVVLVAVATGAVFVGKRLVSVFLGRGML